MSCYNGIAFDLQHFSLRSCLHYSISYEWRKTIRHKGPIYYYGFSHIENEFVREDLMAFSLNYDL